MIGLFLTPHRIQYRRGVIPGAIETPAAAKRYDERVSNFRRRNAFVVVGPRLRTSTKLGLNISKKVDGVGVS